jgi:hypothetical protein
MTRLMPLLIGVFAALATFAAFRLGGHLFFFEGRAAANAQAILGALAGTALGFFLARAFGLQGAALAAVPGLLLMAAVTSHFGLAFPALDPKLDKGFGGLMLWLHGFWIVGGLIATRPHSFASGDKS